MCGDEQFRCSLLWLCVAAVELEKPSGRRQQSAEPWVAGGTVSLHLRTSASLPRAMALWQRPASTETSPVVCFPPDPKMDPGSGSPTRAGSCCCFPPLCLAVRVCGTRSSMMHTAALPRKKQHIPPLTRELLRSRQQFILVLRCSGDITASHLPLPLFGWIGTFMYFLNPCLFQK